MPISSTLFNLLQSRFGDVKVSNPEEPMIVTYDNDPSGRRRMNIISRGETYRVCCPFCGDTRNRLWISHRWGLLDRETGSKNYHLAHCFNENCLDDTGTRNYLASFVFGRLKGRLALRPAIKSSSSTTAKPAVMPGTVVPISELAPEHPAVTYLRERGYNPTALSENLGVGYCTSALPEFKLAEDRILIPVQYKGKLVGWQARYVGDRQWNIIHKPKYWTMPGMRTGDHLYNYDNAVKFPYVVITEGVMDVWSVGPPAVALFGKNLSRNQIDKLIAGWGNGCVIVMLDSDASEEANLIKNILQDRVRRVITAVPDAGDPGSLTHTSIWQTIKTALVNNGLSFDDIRQGNLPVPVKKRELGYTRGQLPTGIRR